MIWLRKLASARDSVLVALDELAGSDDRNGSLVMYQVGSSAIGNLVRTRNKVPINPFPEGQALLKKLRDLAKHFSYAKRLDELHKICKEVGTKPICPKIDKNGTRVMAVWRLVYSMLRLWKALNAYVLRYNRKCATKEKLNGQCIGYVKSTSAC